MRCAAGFYWLPRLYARCLRCGLHLAFNSNAPGADVTRVRRADRQMRSPSVTGAALFRINGVTVTAPNMDMAVRQVVDKLNIEKSFYICTLNLDHLVKLEADDEFRQVYNAAELVKADGFPIVYLALCEGV